MRQTANARTHGTAAVASRTQVAGRAFARKLQAPAATKTQPASTKFACFVATRAPAAMASEVHAERWLPLRASRAEITHAAKATEVAASPYGDSCTFG